MNAIPPNDFNFLSFFLQFGKSGFPPTGAGCRLLIPSWLEEKPQGKETCQIAWGTQSFLSPPLRDHKLRHQMAAVFK